MTSGGHDSYKLRPNGHSALISLAEGLHPRIVILEDLVFLGSARKLVLISTRSLFSWDIYFNSRRARNKDKQKSWLSGCNLVLCPLHESWKKITRIVSEQSLLNALIFCDFLKTILPPPIVADTVRDWEKLVYV